MKMEVDETSCQVDVGRLASYNIYNEEEFPLRLRVFMEPIIQKYNFNNSALDFHSTDADTNREVDQICQMACNELSMQLGEVPRSGPHYVDIQSIYDFMRDFNEDPREFMQRFFKKFELEKQVMASFGDEVLEKLQIDLGNSHWNLVKELKWMLITLEKLTTGIRHLDEFHDSILHNKEMMDRPSKSGNPRVDSSTMEKLQLQKQTYLSNGETYKSKLKEDLITLDERNSKVPDLVQDFTSNSHTYLTEIRIRDCKLLDKAIGDLKKNFSQIKELMQKIKSSIDIFSAKISSSQYASFFNLPSLNFDTILNGLGFSEYELCKNAVVVSVEPRFSKRCLKKDKKINQYELIVLFERAHVSKNRIVAHLLTEAGLRRIRNELRSGKVPTVSDSDLGGKFKCKSSTLDQEDDRKGYKLTFKDLTITEASRKHKANLAVTQQKHAILFSGEICIDSMDVMIHCFSLPVIVTVHGNQMSKSLAAIFWDDNFYRGRRSGLEVNEKVKWEDVASAIVHLFRRELGREPTRLNLSYMKERLVSEIKDSRDASEISFEAFLKAPSKNTKISFWEWLWGSIQLLDGDPTLRQLWNDGYIMGYINQNQAKTYLNERRSKKELPLNHAEAERLFLIRFSESDKELITIQGHLFDQTKGWNVFSVKPYKADDLKSISLSQRILDRQDCQTLLYEKNNEWRKAKKDEVFQSETPQAETALRYGYIAWTLKERTDDSDIRNFRIDLGDDETDASELNRDDDISDVVSELKGGISDVNIPDDEMGGLEGLEGKQSLLDWLLAPSGGSSTSDSTF